MTAITAILLIFPAFSLLTEIFPCYEFRKSGDGVAAESPGGPSLLVIAVIAKPGARGKRDIFPVLFPDHGNLELDELSPWEIAIAVRSRKIAVIACDRRDRKPQEA
jgi:hypothetical protein